LLVWHSCSKIREQVEFVSRINDTIRHDTMRYERYNTQYVVNVCTKYFTIYEYDNYVREWVINTPTRLDNKMERVWIVWSSYENTTFESSMVTDYVVSKWLISNFNWLKTKFGLFGSLLYLVYYTLTRTLRLKLNMKKYTITRTNE